MTYGSLKYALDRGYCEDCLSRHCECVEESEPVAVFCSSLLGGQYRDTNTGRIISEKKAEELIRGAA